MNSRETEFNHESEPKPEPSPENHETSKITPEIVLQVWRKLSEAEKKFILSDDDRFEGLIKRMQIPEQKVFLYQGMRKLIRGHDERAGLIIAELDEQDTNPPDAEDKPDSKEQEKELDPFEKKGFTKIVLDGEVLHYVSINGRHGWQSGIAIAEKDYNDRETKVKYPSEEQALKLLRVFKESSPDRPVAMYINTPGSFVYISGSGELEGRKDSTEVPEDTELFITVIPDMEINRGSDGK